MQRKFLKSIDLKHGQLISKRKRVKRYRLLCQNVSEGYGILNERPASVDEALPLRSRLRWDRMAYLSFELCYCGRGRAILERDLIRDFGRG